MKLAVCILLSLVLARSSQFYLVSCADVRVTKAMIQNPLRMYLQLIKELLCVNVNNSGYSLGPVDFLTQARASSASDERV